MSRFYLTTAIDYANVPLTVTFGRGDDRVNVVVRPTADTLAEGTETVILTLTGALARGTVWRPIIAHHGRPELRSLMATV
mgnify:CR=1 FL=1